MDWGLVVTIVVGIAVTGGVVGSSFERYLSFKEQQLKARDSDMTGRIAEHAARNERLEQRVRTLERIITDGNSSDDLARSIADLREKQPV